MKNRVGESRKMNNGLMATIIEYRGSLDIDIQFENGQTVRNRTYGNFKNGEIKCPMLIQQENDYLRVTNPNNMCTFIIDYEDVDRLKGCLWSYSEGYIIGHNKKQIRLHRIIMNAPGDQEVDHINGDKSDNRKCNLRMCTTAENQHNRGKCKNNSSGYKGVSFNKRDGKFRASIRNNNKRYSLGCFKTPEDAARAYNEAAIKYHKEFSQLNNIGGSN